MSNRFATLHLGGLILIIIVFLWATMPGHAHAQQLQLCVPMGQPGKAAPPSYPQNHYAPITSPSDPRRQV